MMRSKRLFGILEVAVIAVVCMPGSVLAAMNVNIDYVVQSFLDNPIRAEQSYMNKEVEAEGTVTEIKRDSYGGFMIALQALNTRNFNYYFHCWLDSKTLNTAASLNRGSTIAVRGKVYDFQQRERGIIIEGNIVFLGDSVITRIITQAELDFRAELGRAYNGNAQAQVNVALKYANGDGVERNYSEAVRWNREAVNKGNAKAMNNLGWAYENGQGVEQNYSEAMKLYRQAADKGEVLGMRNLGRMYENGIGVSKNLRDAVKWYYKAAVKNHDYALQRLRAITAEQDDLFAAVKAQSLLGDMYYNGSGIKIDYGEAFRLYKMGAANGHSGCMYMLGICYEEGRGTAKNVDKAMKWYLPASNKGHANAMYRLAKIYEGRKAALSWAQYLRKAKNSGSSRAAEEYANERNKGVKFWKMLHEARVKAEQGDNEGRKNLAKFEVELAKVGGWEVFKNVALEFGLTDDPSIYFITGNSIGIHTLPNNRSKIIHRCSAGDYVTLIKTFGSGKNTWCSIKTPQGLTGWVSRKFLTQN